MSGICGWLGGPTEAGATLIAVMAAPLSRCDGSQVHQICGRISAAAVAAPPDAVAVAQHDGVLAAVWGWPTYETSPHDAGVAQALLRDWPCRPAELCRRLHGPFALCLLDERRGEAILAVDRMAVHPLVWQLAGETLVFASSADALIRHPRTPGVLDRQGIYDYVYGHVVPGPRSIYRQQQRLLPGQLLYYRQGSVSTDFYWRMRFDETQELPFPQLRETFLALLRRCVRDAAGHGKVAAFLSGGTDSSTLAGLLRELNGVADAYSIGFAADGYDEMAYARLAAGHFGLRHHAYYVTPDDVVNAIPRVAAASDQPTGNASVIPAYYCARLAAADGVTHMLGGDGGDELFGGNERYARQHVFDRYAQLPGVLRRALLEPLVHTWPGDGRLAAKARSYIAQARLGMPARLDSYNLLARYGARQVFTPAFLADIDEQRPQRQLAETYARTEANSLINRMLALDFQVTLADNDLPKVRQACELAGVSVRFPFLDDAMVAFSATLSPRQKLNGSQLRWFFKKALADFLPADIINKQKHGFGLPFGVWLRAHPQLMALSSDSLSDLSRRDIVRADFIDTLLKHHLNEHAGYHGTMVWVLMMLEQWLRSHKQG